MSKPAPRSIYILSPGDRLFYPGWAPHLRLREVVAVVRDTSNSVYWKWPDKERVFCKHESGFHYEARKFKAINLGPEGTLLSPEIDKALRKVEEEPVGAEGLLKDFLSWLWEKGYNVTRRMDPEAQRRTSPLHRDFDSFVKEYLEEKGRC